MYFSFPSKTEKVTEIIGEEYRDNFKHCSIESYLEMKERKHRSGKPRSVP